MSNYDYVKASLWNFQKILLWLAELVLFTFRVSFFRVKAWFHLHFSTTSNQWSAKIIIIQETNSYTRHLHSHKYRSKSVIPKQPYHELWIIPTRRHGNEHLNARRGHMCIIDPTVADSAHPAHRTFVYKNAQTANKLAHLDRAGANAQPLKQKRQTEEKRTLANHRSLRSLNDIGLKRVKLA